MSIFQEYFELAKAGTLPQGFDQWNLANPLGWTVAHEAAKYGHLPENFDQWELADNDGWTVAHEAAKAGTLPEDFDQWELKDFQNRTVSHWGNYALERTSPEEDLAALITGCREALDRIEKYADVLLADPDSESHQRIKMAMEKMNGTALVPILARLKPEQTKKMGM